MGMFTYGGAVSGLKERISILDGGNVGIGTTTPSAMLDVAGAVKITDGTQGAGKVLTSDASGNASWQKSNSANNSVGFGSWGDCSTNAISEYNPVADPDASNGDYHGQSVAISGNFAIVGSSLDDIGVNSNQGSVCFYRFDGTNWIQIQKIAEAGGGASDYFGEKVSISGNYAFVGISGDDVGSNADQGSVNVYFYNGSNWVFQQKLTDATGLAGDGFGSSVCVSGSLAIIGAPGDDNIASNDGSASIYILQAGSWVLKQKITDPGAAANDGFGSAVSISNNYAVIGAENDDATYTNQGSACIFYNNGSNWVFAQKLTDLNPNANARFGTSVSISGFYLVIGASFDNNNGGTFDQGAAHFYKYNLSSWVLTQKTIDASSNSDRFGSSVFLAGDYAIVGAPYDVGAGSVQQEGSATIYQRIGMGWQKVQKFFDPDPQAYNSLGNGVAIDAASKRFVVGVPGYAGYSGKALFGKLN